MRRRVASALRISEWVIDPITSATYETPGSACMVSMLAASCACLRFFFARTFLKVVSITEHTPAERHDDIIAATIRLPAPESLLLVPKKRRETNMLRKRETAVQSAPCS